MEVTAGADVVLKSMTSSEPSGVHGGNAVLAASLTPMPERAERYRGGRM